MMIEKRYGKTAKNSILWSVAMDVGYSFGTACRDYCDASGGFKDNAASKPCVQL
jgi:hypothetical protein